MSKKEIIMKLSYFLRSAAALSLGLALLVSDVPSVCHATEESTAAQETDTEQPGEEPERLEPDAYFDPIQTDSIEGWPQGPAVWAESAVVMDLDSHTILYSKNMDAIKYPASITKIMTSLLAIENTTPDERIRFSKNAIFGIEQNSSHIGIRVNEVLSAKDCLHGIMLESANEVCLAIAEHIAGSVDAFVDMMNQRATELGCTNTHFTNPNGLPDENHYTTAHDMALIAEAAYKNPEFRQLVSTQYYTIPYTNVTGEKRGLRNHHKMLPDGKYAYEGCTGGKTGFTEVALNTLVTFAERNNRRLVCVSLRTNGPMIYQDTASMLDYGFNNFQNLTVYSRTTESKAALRYPDFYFDPNCSLYQLRPNTTITIPISACIDDINTISSYEEINTDKEYRYHQHLVGKERVPTTAFTQFMTKKSDKHLSSTPQDHTKVSSSTPVPSQHTRLILLCLVGILLLILLIEIIFAINHKRKKKKKRKSHHKY